MNHGRKQARDDDSGAEGRTGHKTADMGVVIQVTYMLLPTSAFTKREHEQLKIKTLEAFQKLMRRILIISRPGSKKIREVVLQ